MNFYDSERMADLLATKNFEVTDNIDDADLVILNTCHIREKAAEKTYSDLGRIKKLKDKKAAEGKIMLIAVAGCVAQAEGKAILDRAPYVDVVVGPQSYQRLPDLVNNAEKMLGEKRDRDKVVSLDFSVNEKFDVLPQEFNIEGFSAFLTIQEGCDKFCTYCVVPYTRGAEYSRSADEIVREAEKLVSQGIIELNLLGQNVNAYHGKDLKNGGEVTFADLIRRLAKIDSLERIRYMTSHPKDMTQDLIAAHGEIDKLMPMLHLPVQSGSDKVLKEMNRHHTAAEYRDVIKRLKEVRPDMAVSSDFIVGFPGETEEEFAETLQLIDDIGFSQCYSFKYSARPGTPSAAREDNISEEVMTERLNRMQNTVNKHQLKFNEDSIGKIMPVLLERKGKHEGELVGKSPYMQSVRVKSPESNFGKIVDVKIMGAFAGGISGEVV